MMLVQIGLFVFMVGPRALLALVVIFFLYRHFHQQNGYAYGFATEELMNN